MGLILWKSKSQHRYLVLKNPTFKMSDMVGLLFGSQCVIQSQNMPYEQNSYYRDFCELPHLQIAYLYVWTKYMKNKANLRDLIAVTGLVILRNLDSNNWFFILYDLEIRWITSKINRAPLLGHIKLCASFQSHQWIQTEAVELQSRNAQFRSKWAIFCHVWPWNLKDDFEKQQGTSSMLLQAFCIIS